jgi:hypothetical protein
MAPLQRFRTWYEFRRIVRRSWTKGGQAIVSTAGQDSSTQVSDIEDGRLRVLDVLDDRIALDIAEISSAAVLSPDVVREILDELLKQRLIYTSQVRGNHQGYLLVPISQLRLDA